MVGGGVGWERSARAACALIAPSVHAPDCSLPGDRAILNAITSNDSITSTDLDASMRCDCDAISKAVQ
jgi:hypothetical protein